MNRLARAFVSAAMIAVPLGAARAATITVAPGEVAVNAGNGLCSLREAIANAESDTDTSGGDCVAGSGTDTIVLAAGSTYALPDAAPTVDPNYGDSGLPAISTAIVIDGNGATIERDSALFSGSACSGAGAKFRIVYVAPSGDLALNNLTLRYGCADFGFRGAGGAIFNRGNVSAIDAVVSSSQALSSGGAIQNDGTMTLTRSTVNSSATTVGAGGAIVNTGTLNVAQSTIEGNQTPGAGGGIDNPRGSAQLANSTLSGNSSAGNGGAIFNMGTSLTLTNATVAANHGTSIAAAATPGSGLYSWSSMTLANTLLALQVGGSNCSGFVSSSNSLADDASCTGATFTATPMIGPLAFNGGPTRTHALLVGSPAIDTGNNATCSAAPVSGIDQRGFIRPQFGASGFSCDVGAYEYSAGSFAARRVDFDADGHGDLVLRHADGGIEVRLMQGTAVTGSATFAPSGPGHIVTTTGDFNGDGKTDLLYARDDGAVEMWLMDGTSLTGITTIMAAGTGWSVAHVADFDGDGKSDILWRGTSGAVGLWLMNGSTASSRASLVPAGSTWSPELVGDFNGDGHADIVWRNGDGSVSMWLMNGTSIADRGALLGPGSASSPIRVGDLDHDGKSDLLFQSTDGSVALWLMDGRTATSNATLMGANSDWTVAQVADFNGDGADDLLWIARDGTVGMWLMSGTTRVERKTEMQGGAGWSVSVAQDLSNDPKADLVWTNTSGAVGAWIMDGTSIASHAPLEPAGSTNAVVPVRFHH